MQNEKKNQIEKQKLNKSKVNVKIFTILGGAIFVRWGKHGCPDNDTELVYSGMDKILSVFKIKLHIVHWINLLRGWAAILYIYRFSCLQISKSSKYVCSGAFPQLF